MEQMQVQMPPATINLPRLNNLTPSLDSTLLKAVEEAGELARAVLKFLPYEGMAPEAIAADQRASSLLDEVAAELLDVAQVCVTMIFVMESGSCPGQSGGFKIDALIGAHLAKLQAKGYAFDRAQSYRIAGAGEFKYLSLPRLSIKGVNLLTTVCKIGEELGELTEYLGKRAGASGEESRLPPEEVLTGCALELLDVAQCCFTMMYILGERYEVDIGAYLTRHLAKLRAKGYCR